METKGNIFRVSKKFSGQFYDHYGNYGHIVEGAKLKAIDSIIEKQHHEKNGFRISTTYHVVNICEYIPNKKHPDPFQFESSTRIHILADQLAELDIVSRYSKYEGQTLLEAEETDEGLLLKFEKGTLKIKR